MSDNKLLFYKGLSLFSSVAAITMAYKYYTEEEEVKEVKKEDSKVTWSVMEHGIQGDNIFLSKDYDGQKVMSCLSNLIKLHKEVKEIDPTEKVVFTVGCSYNTWIHFDEKPPKELMTFETKKQGENVIFPCSNGNIFLMIKSTRVDLCYELVKRFVNSLGDACESFTETLGFAYLPIPMAARDLSGFLDGTRNPDHLLRAIVDEVLIFPEEDDDSHVGGTYMYAGKFAHDLKKFNTHSDDEKSKVVGRDYTKQQPHRGYDTRPENPKLETIPQDSHIARGYGSMYRHAMPFREEKTEGLYFVSVARSLDEMDEAIDRMSGKFSKDGSLDGLFRFTKAVTSNYYYVPSLKELENLEKVKFIQEPVIHERKRKGEGKFVIYIEHCSNCGYKTLFNQNVELLESLHPEIRVVGNPVLPRLSSYEVYFKDGPILWSKLSQPDGKNNYPHVFPKEDVLISGVAEHLKTLEIKIDVPKRTENTLGTRSGIW